VNQWVIFAYVNGELKEENLKKGYLDIVNVHMVVSTVPREIFIEPIGHLKKIR
jgi:hypothetical protein